MGGPRAEVRSRPRSLLAVLVPLVTVALAGSACAGGASGPPSAAAFPATETAVPAAPLPFAAPPIVPRETGTRPATTRATTASRSPTSTPRRSTSARGAGCGRRAVASGRFDPSCAEYQGYLDPGVAGGRAPSSGDVQRQDACDEGLLPASEC